MWKDLQVIWLCLAIMLCLALASWAHGAVNCKVTYNNTDTGKLVLQCPAKTTIGLEVGDIVRGSKVDNESNNSGK